MEIIKDNISAVADIKKNVEELAVEAVAVSKRQEAPMEINKPTESYSGYRFKKDIFGKAQDLFASDSGFFMENLKNLLGLNKIEDASAYDLKAFENFDEAEKNNSLTKKIVVDQVEELLNKGGNSFEGIGSASQEKIEEFKKYLQALI